MEMRLGELVDRYTVALLYTERLGEQPEERARLSRGLDAERILHPDLPWEGIIDLMYKINGFIWEFEAPIHQGKLDCEPVMAGVLALRVRKLNAMRVGLSNLIDRIVVK